MFLLYNDVNSGVGKKTEPGNKLAESMVLHATNHESIINVIRTPFFRLKTFSLSVANRATKLLVILVAFLAFVFCLLVLQARQREYIRRYAVKDQLKIIFFSRYFNTS